MLAVARTDCYGPCGRDHPTSRQDRRRGAPDSTDTPSCGGTASWCSGSDLPRAWRVTSCEAVIPSSPVRLSGGRRTTRRAGLGFRGEAERGEERDGAPSWSRRLGLREARVEAPVRELRQMATAQMGRSRRQELSLVRGIWFRCPWRRCRGRSRFRRLRAAVGRLSKVNRPIVTPHRIMLKKLAFLAGHRACTVSWARLPRPERKVCPQRSLMAREPRLIFVELPVGWAGGNPFGS